MIVNTVGEIVEKVATFEDTGILVYQDIFKINDIDTEISGSATYGDIPEEEE